MLRFLSDEWIEALDRAGSDTHPEIDAAGTGDAVLTIEQRVRCDPDEVCFSILVGHDGVRVRSGPAPDADVTFVVDRDTAVGISKGERSAQAAFMSGDLVLLGEASALVRAQAALSDLGDRFASVRAETIW